MDHKKEMRHSGAVKKHSITIRLWHWLNALIITGSLVTVLLNSTLFDVKTNAAYIEEQLHLAAVNVTKQQAASLAHGMEDKVWDIHIYFGIALTALFLFRLLSSFFQTREQRFFFILKETVRSYRSLSQKSTQALHDVSVKVLYLLFYIFLSITVMTGLTLTFKQELGISEATNHNIKEFHGFSMYVILAFIALHIIGVILADVGKNKGIVSEMIHGGKR